MYSQKSAVFEAQTATITSQVIDVTDAEAIAFYFKAASITSGNGVFKVQGTPMDSPASADWQDLMLVSNIANAISENLTRVVSKTLSTNTGAMFFLDAFVADALKKIRIICTVTTDGSYSAYANIKRRRAHS